MKQWIPWFVVALVALGLVAYGLRARDAIPKNHRLTRIGRFERPPKEVWGIVTDSAAWPTLRTDLASIERLEDVRGHEVWRETWPDGETVTWETVEKVGERKLVRCVTDTGGPYGGCWTIVVAPREDRSTVSVTEQLTVKSEAWRFYTGVAARRARIEGYLTAIGAQAGGPDKFADDVRELRDAAPVTSER